MTQDSHSRDLRVHRRTDLHGCWLVTKCVQPRVPALDERMRVAITEAFRHCAQERRALVSAFVVMPDHWHLLVALEVASSLSRFMGSLNHWISKQTLAVLRERQCRWQDGFHDTVVRSWKQFGFFRSYVEGNPVRQECVGDPAEWPWSSAHASSREWILPPGPGWFAE